MSKAWEASKSIKLVMAEIINRYIKSKKLSMAQAGYDLGVSTTTVFSFVNDKERPTIDTYIHALASIGYDIDFSINGGSK